jgi:hypothetical protein
MSEHKKKISGLHIALSIFFEKEKLLLEFESLKYLQRYLCIQMD